MLEQIGLLLALEARLPQQVALLVVAVELTRELIGLLETVEQLEQLVALQVSVHAVVVVEHVLVQHNAARCRHVVVRGR